MPPKRDPSKEITVTPWPSVPGMHIEIAKGKVPAAGRAANALWRKMCAANPRLHNGDVLAVEAVDFENTTLVCRRESYKRFVTAKAVGERIEALGVTGIVIRKGRSGNEVLIGKRSTNVRIYGGLWETAPRGTVEPPKGRAVALLDLELKRALRRESSEELMAFGAVIPLMLICVVRDPVASSIDLCYQCLWYPKQASRRSQESWEYDELRWVPTRALLRRKDLSPPTRALLLAMKARSTCPLIPCRG